MKNWLAALIPPALLAVAGLTVRVSGNDKAPYFFIMAIGIVIGIMVISGGVVLFRWPEARASRSLCIGAALTLAYVIAVIALSRAGLADPVYVFGFR